MTLKDLFTKLASSNQLNEFFGLRKNTIAIYFEDCKIYEGTSYKAMENAFREEWVSKLVDAILKVKLDGMSTTFTYTDIRWDGRVEKTDYKIEIDIMEE